jgi:hypothetical protein
MCPETRKHLQSPRLTYNTYANEFIQCRAKKRCNMCMRTVADRGTYDEHVARWFRLFGRRNVLVLQSDQVYSKAPKEVVSDTLRRVGSFLQLQGPEWDKKTKNGMPHSNDAGRKGYTSFKISQVAPEICTKMAAYYKESNQKLYQLLRSTKANAPPEQPDFPKFKNPCEPR